MSEVQAEYKIVQVDPDSLRILDAATSMHEIMDTGVYLLEIVTKGRQPYPQMTSIYFISPQENIVEQVIKDFTPPTVRLASGRKGPAYADAHLFFTDSVPQAIFEKLAASPAAPHIKSFVEAYLNFVAFESRVYHLGVDEKVFGRIFREAPAGSNPNVADLQRIADQMVCAYITMNELPNIRYQKTSYAGNALKLATLVQESFDRYQGRNPDWKPLKDGSLLIVDRTIDLLAPLLHEFTLQAMANDLLPIEDGRQYSYTYKSGGADVKREVLLDEADTMWVALRHRHIAEVSKVIMAQFNTFLEENRTIQPGSAGNGNVASLAELRQAMNSMGEFHELKNMYSLHLTLSQACVSVSDQRKLIDVARVEQDMATGSDAEGEAVADVWAEMAPLLDRSNLTSTDKARLVMIYLLTQPSLSDADRKALMDHAKLGKSELDAVRRLAVVSQGSAYTQRKPAVMGKKGARKTILDEEFTFEVSRYVPATTIILDDLVNGELDDAEFPFLKGGQTTTSTKSTSSAPISLRARSGARTSAADSTKGSISAFVLGGATYSELRGAYEVFERNEHKHQVYIGSDSLITPATFLAHLRSE